MCSVSSTTVKAFGLCSFNHRTSATALFYNTTHTDEEELPWWLSVEQNLPAMQETWVLIPGSGRSSGVVLAWRIPWIDEPGGLQSMGPQKHWTRPSD